ncbi:MAG: signal peptidase II [Vulcanimicrobiota bacterium]
MIYIFSILSTIFFDQLTKIYIIKNFNLHQVQSVIGDFFTITYSTNTGGAFGVLDKYPQLFLIMSMVLTVLGIIFYKKIVALPVSFQVALGLVLGGSLGNLIDRLRFGSVVDFINFNFWPTFNVADIAICVGVGILIINIAGMDTDETTVEKTGFDKKIKPGSIE